MPPLRPQAPAEQERKRRHIDDAEREPDGRGKRKGRGRPRAAERREQQDKSRPLGDMAQNGKRAKLDVVIPFHLIHPCKISVLRLLDGIGQMMRLDLLCCRRGRRFVRATRSNLSWLRAVRPRRSNAPFKSFSPAASSVQNSPTIAGIILRVAGDVRAGKALLLDVARGVHARFDVGGGLRLFAPAHGFELDARDVHV